MEGQILKYHFNGCIKVLSIENLSYQVMSKLEC